MPRILVPTDLTARSDRAIRRATLLAREMAAELRLVHVVDDDLPDRIAREVRQGATALLKEMSATIAEHDAVQCTSEVVSGELTDVIGQASGEPGTVLTVVGPPRHRPFRDFFRGSTVDRLVRSCATPVLVANAPPAAPYHCVMVAVDMSPASARALRAAQDLNLLTGVLSVVYHGYHTYLILPADETPEDAAAAQAELDRFLAEAGYRPLEAIVGAHRDTPGLAIEEMAQTKAADLIVLGTQGRTGAGKFVFGSVAADVLAHSSRDVLVVPPAD